jgi:5-methyltetrahydrofolate--homocysteine methyltransferase
MPDYAQLNQFLYEGNAKEVERLVREALAENRPVDEVLNDGLIAGMAIVGEDFKYSTLYVPEVLVAARAMKAGMAILKPLLVADAANHPPRGTLIMGTVKGDLHDIGKNLVCMMMEGAGFEVVDLGINNAVEKYLAAIEEHKPDILGMSALLTTTMPYMKVVIDTLREKGMRDDYIVLVGGAPLNEDFARQIGADAYCRDAAVAVQTAKDLIARRHNRQAAG